MICGINEKRKVFNRINLFTVLKPTAMLKKIIILAFICFSFEVKSQEISGQYIHKHLVRSTLAIVPGYMFKDNLSNVYINGNVEYYLDNVISFRGDGNYMMGSTGFSEDSIGLKNNHSLMLGPVFHFQTKGHFDPYVIAQPGLAYTSSYRQTYVGGFIDEDSKIIVNYKERISPVGTVGLGFNYYFQRFAHLFAETRYVYGTHVSNAPSPISLQELRFTFGLGFNLFIIKEKKKSV